MSDWKPAKKAFTKAQKKRRSVIKEEFDDLMAWARYKPQMIQAIGEWNWILGLMKLNKEYRDISEGRDELMNNTMFLFAMQKPELFDKIRNRSQQLTEEERKIAIQLLKGAREEGAAVIKNK